MNRTIFHQHVFPIRDKLYRFALRITGSVHEAEDIVQEVLERIWKTPEEQTKTVQNWEAWCMTITRNRSLDKTRSMAKRRTASLEGEAERMADYADPGRLTETRDLTTRIQQLMQALPAKQRMVMHLRDIEELSYDEIAEVLDISLDQVKVNLHRARKSIRKQMLQVDATVLSTH